MLTAFGPNYLRTHAHAVFLRGIFLATKASRVGKQHSTRTPGKKKEGKLPVRKKKKPTVTARTALNRWLLRLLDPQPPCTRFEKNSPMPGSAPGHLLSVSRRKKRQKQTRDQKLKGKWVNQCLFTRTRLLFQYKLGDLLNTPILRFMHHSSIYILLIDQGEQNQHKTPNICY